MLPVNLLMLSELKLVNVSESLRCLLDCFTSSVGCLGSNKVGGCCKVCKSFCTAGVIARLLVSSRCWFPCPWWYQECVVLWLAISCCSPLSQQHHSRCSWCSAGVLEGSVTWSQLSVSPPFFALFVPCPAGMRRGHGCSLWPQGVRTALRVGRLTSNCSTERHFTVPHEAVISGLAPESTCYACKCEVSILRTKLGSFFITLARFSRHV